MSGQEKVLEFISFCAEIYAKKNSLSGMDVMKTFSQKGVIEYLNDCYEPLHTQGEAYILSCVNDFLENHK